MKKIIVIESNTSDLLRHAKLHGLVSPSDSYIKSLNYCRPDYEYLKLSPYENAIDPALLADCDGAAFTGSNVAWTADATEAKPLRQVMESLFAAGKPVIGSCNGMQLAATILGGALGSSANGFEVGLAQNIELTKAGQSHPMMQGRQPHYAASAIHRDEVQQLPEGALLLASNAHSKVQAFAYQQKGVDFWGMQYHPEMRPQDVADTLRIGNGIFTESEQFIADLQSLETDEVIAQKYGTTVDALSPETRMLELNNWLRHL